MNAQDNGPLFAARWVTVPSPDAAVVESTSAAIRRVLDEVLSDGRWLTLAEMEHELQRRGVTALTTSISARLRELRRAPFNRYVQKRTREGTARLVEYAARVEARS